MLINFLTVALRNLLRNKAFALINILGLSIGISSALVIFLIAHYDFSFDRFEPGGDRIYRVVARTSDKGDIDFNRGVPAPLGEVIRKELTGTEEVATLRYYSPSKTTLAAGPGAQPTPFKAPENIILADQHFFSLLPYG